jgi:transcriptional regulator with XRE-family HTH domain
MASRMNGDLDNKEYRDSFVESMIRTGLAFQIKELRKRATWSQQQLGERAGTTQNVISRLEDPDYGRFTLNTLLRLAAAFDVALIVKFASFGELYRLSKDRSPDALAVENYQTEKARESTTRRDNLDVPQTSKVTPLFGSSEQLTGPVEVTHAVQSPKFTTSQVVGY